MDNRDLLVFIASNMEDDSCVRQDFHNSIYIGMMWNLVSHVSHIHRISLALFTHPLVQLHYMIIKRFIPLVSKNS